VERLNPRGLGANQLAIAIVIQNLEGRIDLGFHLIRRKRSVPVGIEVGKVGHCKEPVRFDDCREL
jgi:hypothetical protein